VDGAPGSAVSSRMILVHVTPRRVPLDRQDCHEGDDRHHGQHEQRRVEPYGGDQQREEEEADDAAAAGIVDPQPLAETTEESFDKVFASPDLLPTAPPRRPSAPSSAHGLRS
jgi:hypothetical protein